MDTLPLVSSAGELSFSARLLVAVNGRSMTEAGVARLLAYALRFGPRSVVGVVIALPLDGFGALESTDGFVPLMDVVSIDEMMERDRAEATAIRKFVEASLRQRGLTGSVSVEHRSVFDVTADHLSKGAPVDAVIIAAPNRSDWLTRLVERHFGLARRLERRFSIPVITLGAR